MLDVFDFSFAGMFSQHSENGTANLVWVHRNIIFEGFLDVIQEIFFATLLVRLPLERPAFIIETPNEHWQLRS